MAVLDGISGLTSGVSLSRKLLDAYSGSFYELAGGANLNKLFDQAGGTVDWWIASGLAGYAQLTTAGPASRAAANCTAADASPFNARKTGGTVDAVLSDIVSASTKYFIISLIVSSYTTNDVDTYENETPFNDNAGYFGLFFKSTPTACFYNWDGSDDHADVAAEATGTVMTLECRHESGNIYIRKNAGSWSSATASGNTSVMTGVPVLGGIPTQKLNGYVFESAVFNTIPSTGNMDAIAADFYSWVTTVVTGRIFKLAGIGGGLVGPATGLVG